MSKVDCNRCGGSFDAQQIPQCPTCLVTTWLATEKFVRPKHDPRLLPLAWESYRSVLSPNLVETPGPHLTFAARSGTWYRDLHYEMFVHMTCSPLGLHPGSGIPEGNVMPEHSLDSLLIAEANSRTEAHAFAVSRIQFEAQVRAGQFEPIASCHVVVCDNLRVPSEERCAAHTRHPGHDDPGTSPA